MTGYLGRQMIVYISDFFSVSAVLLNVMHKDTVYMIMANNFVWKCEFAMLSRGNWGKTFLKENTRKPNLFVIL